MYEKLKMLSIEILEVEIEDLDIRIGRLKEEMEDTQNKIDDLTKHQEMLNKTLLNLRSLTEIYSDLILEKQREEAQ